MQIRPMPAYGVVQHRTVPGTSYPPEKIMKLKKSKRFVARRRCKYLVSVCVCESAQRISLLQNEGFESARVREPKKKK
jgi:hypothetical protein